MLRIRVIPCLLVRDGALVKTIRFGKFRYIGDPVNTARIFNEKEVDELIVLDISASQQQRSPDLQLISELASECFMPLTYGGGVRSLDDFKKLYYTGVEKVAVNTLLIENPKVVEDAAKLFGSQAIVGSIDVKRGFFGKYEVVARSGKSKTGQHPVAYAKQLVAMGVGEILLNSVDRDGTWDGFDLELTKQVSQSVPVPVIAIGGAGSSADLRKAVTEGGASAVAAGSLFIFQGKDLGVLVKFPMRRELNDLFS